MNYPISIPTIIGEVMDNVRAEVLADLQAVDSTITTVNYMYGNWKELQKRMNAKVTNPTMNEVRFPVVMLIEDITIDQRNSNVFGKVNLNIVIATSTKEEYSSAQREELKFAPILRPIYYSLRKHLSKHKALTFRTERQVQSKYTERKYWGMDDNSKNALNDYIDAIELQDLETGINWQWCDRAITENIS